MSGIRDSLDRDGYGRLSRALADVAAQAGTGELRVSGRPGGAFHFRDGRVVAVESPGAPGPEVLLLRSGRVSSEQWAALMREPGAGRWPEAGLIAHGYAGSVQLRVVCMMAMQDAVFAVLAGLMEECGPLGEGRPLAPVPNGEAPGRLLQEATRKLAALTALPRSVRPDGERPVPAPGTDEATALRLPASQRELLCHADGRRTARDIAFRTGRSVYTVTAEMSRMLQEGHLLCPERNSEPARAIAVSGRVESAATSGSVRGGTASPGQGATTTARSVRVVPVTALAPRVPPPAPSGAGEAIEVSSAPGAAAASARRDAPGTLPVVEDESAQRSSYVRSTGVPGPTAGDPAACPASDAGTPAGRDERRSTQMPPNVLAALQSALPDPATAVEPASASAQPAKPSPTTPRPPEPPPTPIPGAGPAHYPPLPQRRPGASGITETLEPSRSGTSWKGFFRPRSRMRASESGA